MTGTHNSILHRNQSSGMTDTPDSTTGQRARNPMTDTQPQPQQQSPRLWIYRPFSRVVRGYRGYVIVRNYIQLNEQVALGKISYQVKRLRGLSMAEWSLLWS